MSEHEFYTFREYMKNEHELLTPSAEDYLEMIYRLSTANGFTRVNDLAIALNVQPPSVTRMVKKLSYRNLIKYERYGVILMQPSGLKKGEELIARHNLVENFLRFLNIEHDLLEETEKVEHTINAEILCGFQDLLDFFHENPDLLEQFQQFRTQR